MKLLLLLAIFVSGTLTSFAQKETTSRVSNRAETTLTPAQRSWLNANYKVLVSLPKDRAAAMVKNSGAFVGEAHLEFLISHAQTMLQSDGQIADLQQKVEELKAARQGCLNSIIKKEAELAASGSMVKKSQLKEEIKALRHKAEVITREIEKTEAFIRELKAQRMRLGNS